MIWRVALLVWLSAQGALAQEFVSANGPLNDNDFYALVSCGAPPGGTCSKQVVRWDKPAVTVAIIRMDRAFLGGKTKRADVALDLAIAQINAANTAIRLIRDPGNPEPDIPFLFIDMPARSTLENTGFSRLDGTPISAAGVRVFARDGTIERAVILVTLGLQRRAYESVILEELVQALGLLTDIAGPYYETRSVLSQSSNSRTKLGEQDIMALERHYPAR